MKLHKKYLRYLATALAIALLGVYIYKNYDDFSRLRIVRPFYLYLLALSAFFSFLISGALNRHIMHRLGSPITRRESFYLNVLTSFSNIFLPLKGGLIARGVYLNRYYNFAYSDYLVGIVAYYVMLIVAASILALVGINIDRQVIDEASAHVLQNLALVLIIGLPFSLVIAMFTLNKFKRFGFVFQLLTKLKALFFHPEGLFGVFIYSLLDILNTMFLIYSGYRALGVDLPVNAVMVVGTFGVLSFALSITPASIGLFEATVALTASGFGISGVDSVGQLMLGRFVTMLMMLPFVVRGLQVLKGVTHR